MNKMIIVILLLVSSSFSLAGAWAPAVTVTNITTYGNSDLILVTTLGGTVLSPGCEANKWVIDSDSAERRNRIYSMLATAFSTGNKISFWYGESCGIWSYHSSTAVKLVK